MAPPVPESLTLRLKHHKTTVFLYASQIQSLKELKSGLIVALSETNPSGTLNDRPLPTSPEQITLGKPKDRNDYTLGWVRIEDTDGEKGKEKITLKSAGLKEGMVVAFQWSDGDAIEEDEDNWDVVIQTYDEVYGDDP